ncbi:Pleckstrin homology domain-containing family A member 8 [Trichoplax sp. H2]|nr:Pleckstrin homology domain-containing family A member 8 [Trichoplax sp. H2]|eukprot:RDD41022.1 Pleckstrin homology domain-containing family A member 8 [Trichoplax sp. H2]
MAIKLEGLLHKWTNYISGWQPRWFILDDGTLSYYRSEDEVDIGCRGSFKMTSCEISTCPTDLTRIDLFVPPGQYIYVKATTQAERQKWLVALGSSKVCIGLGEQPSSSQSRNISVLKFKLEEVHHYRIRLLQQVYALKFNVTQDQIDQQALDQTATKLSDMCDEFLSNVDSFMQILEAKQGIPAHLPTSEPNTPTSTQPFYVAKPGKPVEINREIMNHSATSSVSSFHSADNSDDENDILASAPPNVINTVSRKIKPSGNKIVSANAIDTKQTQQSSVNGKVSNEDRTTSVQRKDEANETCQSDITTSSYQTHTHNTVKVELNVQANNKNTSQVIASKEQSKPKPLTFFSVKSNRFDLIVLGADGEIPSQPFLAACTEIISFLDIIGPTAFAPVKIDINGNIKKLQQKFYSKSSAYQTLQLMIMSEVEAKSTTVKNSATDALLWLKRALEFIYHFLHRFSNGEQDLVAAANYAYGKALKRFHGWMIRGVFSLACRAIPLRKDLIIALSSINGQQTVATENDVIEDIMQYSKSLGSIIDIINNFYKKFNLDPSLVK